MANKYTAQKIDINKAVQLYNDGRTQAEVAKEMNTSQKVIYSRFKQAEIECRIPKKRNQVGIANSSWKGSTASYAAFHYRVQAKRGKPNICSMCETTVAKRFEWASMTGNYANVYDYVRLCKSCHSRFDNVYANLTGKNL